MAKGDSFDVMDLLSQDSQSGSMLEDEENDHNQDQQINELKVQEDINMLDLSMTSLRLESRMD